MSAHYMNRKLSAINGQPAHRNAGRHQPEPAASRSRPQPATHHSKPEPATNRSKPKPDVEQPNYDWKSNMEARRKQRNMNREKSPAVNTSDSPHSTVPSSVTSPRLEQRREDRNHLRSQPNNMNNSCSVRDKPLPAGRMDRLAAFTQNSPAENRRSPARGRPDPTPPSRSIPSRGGNIRDRVSRFSDRPAETQSDSKPPPTRQGRLAAIASAR